MDESFLHLPLQREEPVNEKRSPPPFPRHPPDDEPGHGRHLQRQLQSAKDQADSNVGGFDERRLFRFEVQKGFNPDDIRKISNEIEFVSQEEETVVIGFASNAALAQFEARLASLAKGERVTNKQVFYALQDVGSWSADDRKGWALKNQGFPDGDVFLLDIELWPLENHREQEELWAAFVKWCQSAGIGIVDRVKQPSLMLCRVKCNQDQGKQLLKNRDVRSVDLPPNFGLKRSLLFQDIQNLAPVIAPDANAPGVVVLDSGLATGHPLLAPAVGDSQSFLPDEEASDEHGHGTHVAGLALYGDFESNRKSGQFVPCLRLFSGRILDRNNEYSTTFIENRIEKAVRYFVDNYQCRVFNLSIGDCNKPYMGGHLKGLSLTLDSLSRELGVLFVVAVGNHSVGEESPDGLEWRDKYPRYLLEDAWKIIEPAPALNVLTVGSLARHERTFSSQHYPLDPAEIPIAKPEQPSPFTCHGESVDGAIKPELMAYGGNWAINTRAGANHLLDEGSGLGVISTHHQFAEGHPFAIDSGTSMAAPQVAHLAAAILVEHPEADPDFIRALLVAHAAVPDPSSDLLSDKNERRKVCGYGQINPDALLRSREDAVTLRATDRITNKRHHFYEVPVPDAFTSRGKRTREISVALAYTPAVRSTRIKYRATRIDFRLVSAANLEYVTLMFNKATREDEYENITELKTATIGKKARSKGTVQADTWRFERFNRKSILKNKRLFVVVTRNDFPWGESLCSTEENYALIVNLRDRENGEAKLYTQIKNQLQARASEARLRANRRE